VLLAKVIIWAIEHGLAEVDMMRGDEVYKYRFGGIDRHVVSFKTQLS
jgi:CelD/BcsL family acetyltransferase involved in cellulose biosynthesis